MKFKFLSVFLAVFFTVSGCGRGGQIQSVEREDLFTLDIGKLEDQIALFNLEGDMGIQRAGLAMEGGLFYISDASGGKVLRYTSYGELLFMIYNDEKNPPPLTLKTLSEGNIVTRWAVPYPLLEPGEITVDSRKHIFVRDRLPYERHGFDTENSALLDSVILHFDQDGRFVEYLGREGIGGSPFPKIEGLYTTVNDELAVVCKLSSGWNIYWFDSSGVFLFVIQLKNEAIPVPPDRDNVFSSLGTICVSPDSRTLYIKVDYYRYVNDESTNTRSGIEQDSSVIWIMNADGVWERHIELPFFEYTTTERNRSVTDRVLYSMLGIAKDGNIFLTFPVDGGYSILVVSSESGQTAEHRQGFIQVDNSELQFNAFDLSADGILSALLVDNYQVKLVWWRTDRFLEEGSP